MSKHVGNIYALMRRKALTQYFSTFSCVDMTQMADVFGTSVNDLEQEIALLIQDDVLNCRIDSQNKV